MASFVSRFGAWLFSPLFWRLFEVCGDNSGRFGRVSAIDFGGFFRMKQTVPKFLIQGNASF